MINEKITQRNELFNRYPENVLRRFRLFHAKNPGVYEKFKELAFTMKKRGRKKYSSEIIVNIIRWHVDLETKGEMFRINNDYTPLYSRLLIMDFPEFDGFFELRNGKSKGITSLEQRKRESNLTFDIN